MVTATEAELERPEVTERPRSCSPTPATGTTEQIERIVGRGHPVLIPPDAGKRKGARPGWDGGLYAFMRRVLATDHGGELYRKRQTMIEPVFGPTRSNRGFTASDDEADPPRAANGA